MNKPLTTFIIPTIGRDTLQRAIDSARANNVPVLYMLDKARVGEGFIRNELIKKATTEWISFLDDDDTVYPDYVQRLEQEIVAHPNADVIHFRQYSTWGHMLPNWPQIEWGNVGISFSVKRSLALEYPFVELKKHEDLVFLQALEKMDKNIYFSKFLTYRVRH